MAEVKHSPKYPDKLPFKIPTEDPLPHFALLPASPELLPDERALWSTAQHELGHSILATFHQIPHDISLKPQPKIRSAARVTLYGDIPSKALQEIIVAPSIARPGYVPFGTDFDLEAFHETVESGGPHSFGSALKETTSLLESIDPRVMHVAARLIIAQNVVTVDQTRKLLQKAVWELNKLQDVHVEDVATIPENSLTTSQVIVFDPNNRTTIENLEELQSLVRAPSGDRSEDYKVCGLCGAGYKTAHVCKLARKTFGDSNFGQH